MSEQLSPETQAKIDQINEVLNRMHTHLESADHQYLSLAEFNKLKTLRDSQPNRDALHKLWINLGLPADDIFRQDIPPSREMYVALGYADEYCEKHKIKNRSLNFGFHLTARDIIDMRIPRRVAACTGHAKLFCHFAKEAGLDCYVVCTADLPKHKTLIDGHQIIAVKMDGQLVAFDPAHPTFRRLTDKTPICVGNDLRSIEKEKPYKITAIVPRDKFEPMVNRYQDIEDLYLSNKAYNIKTGIKNIKNTRNVDATQLMHAVSGPDRK